MVNLAKKILIIGAAGMIGRKLSARLAKDGAGQLILHDVVPFAGSSAVSDLSMPGEAEKLVASRPDVIFHLAAIVSGEAEADFEKGYRINLDGTRRLFEAVRKVGNGYKPRMVFASSIAVFGAPFPEAIGDEFLNAPLTSYGTQKAIGELLLSDYSRRGFFDGIGIRLPTICVRPGKPNKAASGFFSGILREPLSGQEAVLPVPESVRHWFASPRAAIEFLLHAASIDTAKLGTRRNLSMPGISATVGEQIEALRKVGGEKAVRLIRRQPDPAIMRIVEGWPQNFDARRASALGFRADRSFEEIIRIHVEDELQESPPPRTGSA
ncbi:MAG TPA: D-erythronate dehydrogenase [Burkholderiales bacterium]|nr:D-erythronate dehydrogenase [Burkholderiales bacterium]